jgi:ubiquinone/menaquinone biosynthesis C-methylase UbiE
MSAYYRGEGAHSYDRRHQHFTRRTLIETLQALDVEALFSHAERQQRPPRLLDVACGTGILLSLLHERIPSAELSGIDGSPDMLALARTRLSGIPHLRLEHVVLDTHTQIDLPFPAESFDLITCTNALHYFTAPAPALARFGQLLAGGGQLVLEDYARRDPPFPWRAFEWVVRRVDPDHVRAYTLAQAHALCREAALEVVAERAFPIDWLWRGWALRAQPAAARIRLPLG